MIKVLLIEMKYCLVNYVHIPAETDIFAQRNY